MCLRLMLMFSCIIPTHHPTNHNNFLVPSFDWHSSSIYVSSQRRRRRAYPSPSGAPAVQGRRPRAPQIRCPVLCGARREQGRAPSLHVPRPDPQGGWGEALDPSLHGPHPDPRESRGRGDAGLPLQGPRGARTPSSGCPNPPRSGIASRVSLRRGDRPRESSRSRRRPQPAGPIRLYRQPCPTPGPARPGRVGLSEVSPPQPPAQGPSASWRSASALLRPALRRSPAQSRAPPRNFRVARARQAVRRPQPGLRQRRARRSGRRRRRPGPWLRVRSQPPS